jgi:hypothetical protein
MAHFAELDETNTVLRVIVVGNGIILDEQGQESEAMGIAFCQSLFGPDTIWIQTSYNGNIRKNYAGIGHTYDLSRDAFIAPQPEGEGFVLDEATCQWRNPAFEAEQAATKIGVTRV